jgi:hypothetical protein
LVARRGLAPGDIGRGPSIPAARACSRPWRVAWASDDAIEPCQILAEHGNMSSPTVPFILDLPRAASRALARHGLRPGLAVEVALIR